jgi:hypothetical protein
VERNSSTTTTNNNNITMNITINENSTWLTFYIKDRLAYLIFQPIILILLTKQPAWMLYK